MVIITKQITYINNTKKTLNLIKVKYSYYNK